MNQKKARFYHLDTTFLYTSILKERKKTDTEFLCKEYLFMGRELLFQVLMLPCTLNLNSLLLDYIFFPYI